jgi:hypothetical protein
MFTCMHILIQTGKAASSSANTCISHVISFAYINSLVDSECHIFTAAGRRIAYSRCQQPEILLDFPPTEEEEEEGPFNVLSVNVQHLLGRTVFFICDAYVALFLRPDALPDTNTRAVLHE